jgi:hypothetical protein
MASSTGVQDLLIRIQVEYMEMPGLLLTQAQAMCHWQLTPERCEGVFGALVDAGFLARTRDGLFRHTGARPRLNLG